jgi:nucleotide-binding universal stress UspA family protein
MMKGDFVPETGTIIDSWSAGISSSRKTITVFLHSSSSGRKRAAYAAALAQRWDAHLVGVNVVFAGVRAPPSMSYARGAQALKQVAAYKRQLDSDAMAAAARVNEHFQTLCAEQQVSGELRAIDRVNSLEDAIRVAFHSDLVIVGHPDPHGLPDDLSVEKLLLASGAPTLIVPTTWEGETIGDKILIGWNATREARRAVADAMGLLVKAQSVTVLTIREDEEDQDGDERGSDIATWLDRHGAHVHLEQLSSHGFSIPAVLLGYAEQNASDLLVLGAYSQARLKEVLLGGTTRTLLTHMPMPTLMSR